MATKTTYWVHLIVVMLMFCLLDKQVLGGSIESISRGQRTKLCEATQAACKEACNSTASSGNKQHESCDAGKLVWSCECGRNDGGQKIGNRTVGTFPIPDAMCRIDRDLCETSCMHVGEHSNHANICRMQCKGSYPCGTDKAPFYNGTEQLKYHEPNGPRMKDQQQQNDASASAAQSHRFLAAVTVSIVIASYIG